MQSRAAMTRVISFTSGKGGVGKTHTVVNLALSLANRGKSVLVLDADFGLANVDVLLGLPVRGTLADFFERGCSLEQIIVRDPASGIAIIPAANGIESICNLSADQRLTLLRAVEEIAWQYDYLLIDTPAGIGSDVLFFNSASSEIVCVISADPASLTDAYGLMKVLCQKYGERSFRVVVNNVPAEHQARSAFRRLDNAARQFLQLQLEYCGYVPADQSVAESISRQRGVVSEYPSSLAGRALTKLADTIDSEFHEQKLKGGIQFFFQQLLEAGAYGA